MFKRKQIQRKTTVATVCLSVGILFFLILTTPSAAQDYPAKPITIVTGSSAGGSAHLLCQLFADNAQKYLPKSQPILVKVMTGAGYTVAAEWLMKQPADGYSTFNYANDAVLKLARNPSGFHFTNESFIPICSMAFIPCVLPVITESPFKTIEDFIDYAKKNPGKLSYGSSGIGALTHLVGELLQSRAGIKLKHVPFAGGGTPAITAVMGKHIDTYFGTPAGTMLAHLKSGGMRLLAVFGEERLKAYPQVPTFLEKGYDVGNVAWNILVVRQGTPPQVVDILRKVFKKTAEDPEVQKKIESNIGYLPWNLGPEDLSKLTARYYVESKEIITKLGLLE